MSTRTSVVFDAAVERARALLERGGRRLLGIAGPPGAGKSTLAEALCEALVPAAALAPLDGFHLENQVLLSLGLSEEKGSPETFDACGFRALLQRLRVNQDPVVYAPSFRRDLDVSVAGALPVRQHVPLVIVEGNYLLLESGAWAGIADLFDETWYLDLDDEIRRGRLTRRHEGFGRSADEAAAWTLGSDERNAALVHATRRRADLILPGGALEVPTTTRSSD